MLISYFTSINSILPAVIMGMMGCPCVIHKLYVLRMGRTACVFYFLTGAKEVDFVPFKNTGFQSDRWPQYCQLSEVFDQQ